MLISVGYAPAEVRGFSIPKLSLWSRLAEEMKLHDALALSGAVWDPKRVAEMMESERSNQSVSNQCETPRSVEEFERMMGDGA